MIYVFVYFVDVCVFFQDFFSSKHFFPQKKQLPCLPQATRDHCQDLGIGCSGTFHGSIRQGWGISSLFWKLGWTIGTLGRYNGWNLQKKTHLLERNMIDSPNLHEEMFQPLIFRVVNKYESNIPILEWWDIFLYTLPGSLAVCPWKVKKSQ